MQLFNVFELEIQVYATLLSLENADLPILSSIMKKSQYKNKNAIETLEKRE
ncbi:MAG: hypothetical protein ACFFB0_14010 [Promethearchaeota archaeon]